MPKISKLRLFWCCLATYILVNLLKSLSEVFQTTQEYYGKDHQKTCLDESTHSNIASRLVSVEKPGYYDGEDTHNPPSILPEAGFEKEHWGTVTLPPAKPFQINTHDPASQDVWISWSVHKKRVWDEHVWKAIKTILTKSKAKRVVFVDVGANIGYFTLAAAALGAQVIAFEPMNRNLLKLVSSIHRNGFSSHVMLFHNAVADLSGHSVAFHQTAPTNAGNGQLSSPPSASLLSRLRQLHRGGGRYGIDHVHTVRLDSVLSMDIELIKVDVEGFEPQVLAGARRLLCCHTVRHVIIEFLKDARTRAGGAACAPRDVFLWMSAVGYRISDINPPPPLARELPPTLDLAKFPQNLLFTLVDDSAPPALREGRDRANATVCGRCE